MKNLIELTVLERIVAYQVANRQVGHTSAMLSGAAVTDDVLVVVGDWNQKQWMERQLTQRGWNYRTAKNAVITLDMIKNGILEAERGRPLVIDNIGLWALAMDVDEKRRKLLLKEYEKMEKSQSVA